MMKPSGKRLFSLLLAIFMVITMLPPNTVFAEGEIPAEEPSTPLCTGLADCPAETHKDGCPAKPAAEPPVETEPTKPACTGLADCPAETHGDSCEKKLADEKAAADKAAADAVATLIEALPTLEAIQAKPTEEQAVDYEQVMKAYDAFTALTDDQKALLSVDAGFFDSYLTYFASLTQPAADHSHTVCGKTSCSCGGSHSSTVWQSLTSGTTSLSGGNYYLDGDISLSSGLTVSGNVSLCLNGHTLTTTAGKIYISSGCLTICDCTGGGRITGASTNWSVIDLAGSGSLTVYSGTITSTDSSGTAISAYTTGDIQIRGGTVSAGRLALSLSKVNDLTVTSGSITSTSGYGISISQSFHDMKISGGTIKGFENGIHFDSCTCSGKVSISGGTIEATGTNVNAGGYASRLYGIGFSTGNAGTCYVYITGGTVKGAKGGIYNFNPNLTMNISGGTLGTSGTIGIEADRGTVNINGGKVYTVDCGGPATITVTNGEVYCVYMTAGAGSSGAGKLIVTGGTVGRVGSSTSYYGIGNSLSNPTGTISVEISGGTIVGSSYALYSVSEFSAKISGGTFSGATADVYMGKAPASFSTAYISMDGYSGDPLTFSLGTTVKPVAYLARQVANSSLITLVDSTYSLNYDTATKSVILTDIHTHSFNSTTHKCSCGAIGGTCGIGLTWILEDGVLTISGSGAMANYSYSTKAPWDAYKDDITSIVVESGVTTVGDYAFNGLSSVTSATLADSVKTIGSNAFYLCTSMTSIKMSADLTSIGNSAFWRSGLTSIDIPAGVTSIGTSALQALDLTSINVASGNTVYSSQDGVLFNKNKTTLLAYPLGREGDYFMPDSVTKIEGSAFAHAYKLSMVKLSAGLTSVSDYAFSQCTGLFTVVVPESIGEFSDFAFNGCPMLTVYYGGTEAQWKNIRFNSYNNSIQNPRKIYYRAIGTTGDVSYFFYDGTLTVYGNGDMADYEAQGAPWFSYYSEITKIVVEDGVTSIGDYAFDRCERASSITLSKDLTSIGEGAFQDCTSVTALTIPAGVTSIDDKAFRHCTAMKALTFTGNAPTMGDAFYNQPNLTVYYPAGDSSWDSVAGKNYGNQYPVTWIATCGETHDFENGVISYIWASDYSSCTAALTCGNSGCMVSGSGNSKTVKSTSSREEATCSKPGKTVYTAVFSAPYETQTKEVPIPATGEHDYSKEVASAAFRISAATCQSPALYKKSCACGAASDTETFTYGEAGEHTRDENHKCTVCGHIGGFCGISSQNNGKDLCWTLEDGVLTISGTGAMADYASASEPWYSYRNVITSAVVGEGVTTLGQAAFDECEKLQTVELPSTLTVIGKWAFSGCSDLTAIDIPDSVHTIGAAAFGSCDMLTSVTIPALVTEILGSTFYTCDRLETVTLLGDVTTIGDSAFGYCYKLKNFTIPSTVTSIGKYAFRSCWALTDVTIPAGVTILDFAAFSDCKNLSSIRLPEGLTEIGERVFYDCDALTAVTLPSSLTTLGVRAFHDCDGLTSIVIPDDVTSIGDAAFSDCEKLAAVTLPKNLKTIGNSAFYFCPIAQIEIPASVTSIAATAFGYCRSLTEITFLGNAPAFAADAFKEVTAATALYPRTGTGWAEAVQSTYSGTVTWKMYCPNGQHSFEEIVDEAHLVSEATCAQGAVYKKLCPCGEVSATETFIYGEAGDHTRDKNHKCTLCGHIGGFCGIGSQNNGKDICWTLEDGVLTISGTGAMANYNTVTYKAPWDAYTSEIVSVVVGNGITSIGDSAFFRCGSLESVSIADTVTGIGSSAFSYCKELTDLKLPAGLLKIENDAFSSCEKLESVEIPAGVTSIGSVAFLNCEALTSVVIPGSVSSIGQAAFSSCSALEDAYYAGTKANWDEISIGSDNNRLLDTRIHYNCADPAQHWTTHSTEATCTDAGYSVEVCVCATPYSRNKVETAAALGHDMGQWLPNPDKEGEERSDCSRCDHYETRPSGPVILLEDAELQNQSSVWIDGASYPVVMDPDRKIVRVPENSNIKEGSALVTYEYHTGDASDVHTQYPTGMKVWILSQQEDGNFTATRVSEFDNLLQYSGCSIRIVGVKGIRMITSINQSTKKALTGKGLAGYTLVEYGTALCRASALADGQPMTLENSNVKYNYAYKKGVADPVFKYSGNLVQYTNVLVGFTDDDCKDDIAMRPYIILQDAEGETVTIYGGIIYRSIGYIAYQNRNAFAVGSDAYEYVWSIIHHVYGDEFDADYKS